MLTEAPSDIILSLLEHKAIIGENIDDVLNTFEIALKAKADKSNDMINQCIINHHIDRIDPIKLILWIIELNSKVKDNVQKILTSTLTCIIGKHKQILTYRADQKKNTLVVGEAALFSAVKSGNVGMVDLLLQHEVNPSCYDEKGYYPIQRAAETKKY